MFDSTVEDLHFFARAEGYLLGMGVAREWASSSESYLTDMETALKLISQQVSKEVWLVGGWSFPSPIDVHPSRQKQQIWNGFPYSDWIVPALTFITANGRGHLTLCLSSDALLARDEIIEYYEKLAKILIDPSRKSHHMPLPTRLSNVPSRRRWAPLVRRALNSISNGDLRKVVLARSTKIQFAGDIPHSIVLKKLVESNNLRSTIFAVRKGNAVFIGATPEDLLSVRNREVNVDCLAASAPRNPKKSVDESLGRNLLQDAKSRYEHQLVVDQVTRSLSRICSETKVSGDPTVKKLPTVQHLHSTVSGRLLPNVSVWSAARLLWPTPATGGEPREAAIRWIQESEGMERGWYSGIVGYVNAGGDQGNLFVSIRSSIIRRNSAVLFAGSGIVPGSDPEKEFQETGWKMKTMMDSLGL